MKNFIFIITIFISACTSCNKKEINSIVSYHNYMVGYNLANELIIKDEKKVEKYREEYWLYIGDEKNPYADSLKNSVMGLFAGYEILYNEINDAIDEIEVIKNKLSNYKSKVAKKEYNVLIDNESLLKKRKKEISENINDYCKYLPIL